MGNCCSRGNAEGAPVENATGKGEAEAKNAENNYAEATGTAAAAPAAAGGGNASIHKPTTAPAEVVPPTASPMPPQKPKGPVGAILGRPLEDVRAHYTFGKELGRGQFGVTHLVTHVKTGEQYACKTITTRKLVNKEDINDVRREVQIMHHLTGQPNIVDLKGTYEDKNSVHLVMELCHGGELFDRIIAKGHYTERAAASLLRTIVQIVHTCHSMGVIHRDLKPENFLLASKDENAPLKATDFGLSVFYKEGSRSAPLFFFFFLPIVSSHHA